MKDIIDMADSKTEWNLFKQTWQNTIQDKQIKCFEDFDQFFNSLFSDENNLRDLEKIIIIGRRGKAAISQDKKTLYLYKCPFTLTLVRMKKELPINFLFSPILDALINDITRLYPKIQVVGN